MSAQCASDAARFGLAEPSAYGRHTPMARRERYAAPAVANKFAPFSGLSLFCARRHGSSKFSTDTNAAARIVAGRPLRLFAASTSTKGRPGKEGSVRVDRDRRLARRGPDHRGRDRGVRGLVRRSTPQAIKTFARTARKRMRTDGGGYRRDHLRALAQRVEVDQKELRIMGSKSVLLRTLVAAESAKTAGFGVPSSVPKWRTRHDSNV
jgi:hypothetical protein